MDTSTLDAIWDSTATRDDRVYAFAVQVEAAAVEPVLEALLKLYHSDGFNRFIAETETSAQALAAIRNGMMSLGRAGGNTIDSPFRRTWERARAVVDGGPFHGPFGRLPHDA